MLLGSHVSISGGYVNAAIEAARLGIDTIQIFTKNQQSWKEKTVTEHEGKEFKAACIKHGVKQAFSHAIYLISLGSENDDIAEKSMLALAMELERCKTLGLTHTVLHPGAAGTLSKVEAIIRIGDRIKNVLQVLKGNPVKILLENTAGQGSSIGGKLEYISDLIDHIKSKQIGLCIDTCHAFAAGYDIRDPKGIEKFFKETDNRIGLEKLLCFHLNDSKGELGSKLDRHAHIGEGFIGLTPFKYIMQNFPHIPKVLELPKENDADKKNLQILRDLSKK
ncbi:MAG: nfo [Bacteroidetes bacterium]|jgi:deoxyribonuclease-4|nr:nfo [Bacteroidota bacterium]